MPVTDLFAASGKILRKLFGRSRRVALAAALVPLGTVGVSTSGAAPTVELPPAFPAVPFGIRVTDMERISGDGEGDAFRLEFQVLNWTNADLDGLRVNTNVGTSAVSGSRPHISGAGIDPDGRGGAAGGTDIGQGVFDSTAIHSGYGRGDAPDRLNDWSIGTVSSTAAHWKNYDLSIPSWPFVARGVYGNSLLSGNIFQKLERVPGFGVDALGDSAIDGGPEPYTPPDPGFGAPDDRFLYSNVMDGFVLDIDDWDVGEVFSVNWLMETIGENSGGLPHSLSWIGSHNPFGFGVMSLVRIEPTIGSPAGNLPGAVFEGNVGFDQSNFSFYDTVYEIPNPAEFAAEFGQGITAPFLNPADNIFDAQVNTQLIVPEPGSLTLVSSCVVGLAGAGGRGRRGRTRD